MPIAIHRSHAARDALRLGTAGAERPERPMAASTSGQRDENRAASLDFFLAARFYAMIVRIP